MDQNETQPKVVRSYPFDNYEIHEEFMSAFEWDTPRQMVEVIDDTYISGRQSHASLSYLVGTQRKAVFGISPIKKTYNFMSGMFYQAHQDRYYHNLDITEWLIDAKMFPAPAKPWDGARPMATPTVEYDRSYVEGTEEVMEMCYGLRDYDGKTLKSMGMGRFWDKKAMRWTGPAVIGNLHGLEEFENYHQIPFLRAWPNRTGKHGQNKIMISDGNYVASMGIPSMRAAHTGYYYGIEPQGLSAHMFVMDFWTINPKNGMLIDNWVPIDMPALFKSISPNWSRKLDTFFGVRS